MPQYCHWFFHSSRSRGELDGHWNYMELVVTRSLKDIHFLSLYHGGTHNAAVEEDQEDNIETWVSDVSLIKIGI